MTIQAAFALYEVFFNGKTHREAANMYDYAESTIRTYCNKYGQEEVKRIYEENKAFIESNEQSAPDEELYPYNNKDIMNTDINGNEKIYLFKFFENGKLVFSKIGTTTRTCSTRIKEEIRYYNKREFNIDKVEICAIFNCDCAAEGYESYLRSVLIKKYGENWQRNDRFFDVDLPVKRFLTLCKTFQNLSIEEEE